MCGARYAAGARFCQIDGEALVDAAAGEDPYIGRTLLDQFSIAEVIGAGGMGTVYRAHQYSVDRDVAIKILHPELIKNSEAVRRFRREAKVSTALDHPHIVRVYLFGQLPDGSLYLVMEHLRGRSLAELIATEAPLQIERSLHILLQLCDGMSDAHRHGVVHRDVKPENIFLIERGGDPDFAKILDFGIARFLEGEQTALTQSGLIFGTARYISPEAAAGESTGPQSDVYSIGVLGYELLAGALPFESKSPVSLLMKHIHDRPPQLATDAGGHPLPKRIAHLVMRCLEKHPGLRPADAGELAVALREAAEADGFRSAAPAVGSVGLAPVRTSAAPTASSRRMPATGALAATAQPKRSYASLTSFSEQAPSGLALAPTPFGSTEIRVPGLKTTNPRKLLWLLVAMALLAVAAAAGVSVVRDAAQAREARALEQLENRARVALSHGDFDQPPGENVYDLTAALLKSAPAHGPALRFRKDAARRLFDEATAAADQGFDVEANALLRRALRFDQENEAVKNALLQGSPTPVPVPLPTPVTARGPALGIRPERAVAVGQPLQLRADGIAGEEIDFLVVAGARTLRRLPGEKTGPGSFEASYRFRSAGRYTIAIEGEPSLSKSIAVVSIREAALRRTVSDAPFRIPLAPPAVEEGPPGSVVEDGIDWSLPGSVRPPALPVVSRPVDPPTTGGTPPAPEAPADQPLIHPSATPAAPPAPWMNR